VSRATAERHPAAGDSLLVSGMIAAVPGQGGASWAALQYVLGLLRLGYDVHFVEELPVGSDGNHDPARTDSWSYLTALARRFGLEGRMSLVTRGTRCTAGREYGELRELARRCRLLVNLSGTLSDPEILESIPIRLYVDLDPVFTQLWQGEGIDVGLRWHTHFATVGLALGTRSCGIPTCGVDWIPTLPPVCLDEWPEVPTPPTRDAWTTVSHWRGYGSVEWKGRRHGQKAHAFRPLFPLPARSGDRFEVALGIHPRESDDLVALDAHGWTLIDPSKVAGDPDRYQGFVSGSAGEIGVAKEGYVASRSGWFSDRSACYLASGRPVVAQETGFSSYLPTGRGLLAFETLDEAAACVLEARGNYDAHARGARALAEEHLDARVVLQRLLDEIGR
jgi:hypothetical protein